MVGRIALVLGMVAGLLGLVGMLGSARAQDPETFTLSVGGYLCDADPHVSSQTTCTAYGGAVVTVSLPDGTFVGSCVLETFDTPNGGVASGCGVPGVPLNATLVIAVDPASLPPGYVAVDSPQTLEVGSLIPGGGDGPVVGFAIVPQDGEPGDPIVVDDGTDSGGDESAGPPGAEAVGGRAAEIHAGTCADLGDVDVILAPVLAAQGPAVGLDVAIEAETGGGTVAYPLDVLIDEPHAVVVRTSSAADSEIVACGEIGGVDNDDGALAVGLKEVDGSGFVGIAYLAYNAADGSATDVSVFLAEGLADSGADR